MSREKEFVKNSIILTFGTVIPKLTSIITLPIITGCLTTTEYGTYDLINTMVSLLLPVATLQMQTAIFRYLLDAKDNSEDKKKVITNALLFIIVISLCVLIVVFFLMRSIDSQLRALIVLYFFIDILLNSMKQVARGLSLNKVYSASTFLNAIIEMVLILSLLLGLGKGLIGMLLALIISQLCSCVFLINRTHALSYISLKTISKIQIKTMLSYAWPMIPNSLSSWVMRASDRLILTWFMGLEATAVYAVANKLPTFFSYFQSSFTLAWQENATVTVDDEDSGEYYGKMFESIFNLLVGVMALLIAFTPIIFHLLIRGDYDESYNHIPILYIATMFSMISSYMGGIYIARMKTKEVGITTTIAAAINFVFNLLFVNLIGIYAASISTLISYLVLSVFRMHDVQKFQRIKFNYKSIIWKFSVLAAMCVVCFMQITILDIFNMILSIVVAYFLNKELVNMMIKKTMNKIKNNN